MRKKKQDPLKMLGLVPDREIAVKLGVARQTVVKLRQDRGIPAWSKPTIIFAFPCPKCGHPEATHSHRDKNTGTNYYRCLNCKAISSDRPKGSRKSESQRQQEFQARQKIKFNKSVDI